MRLAIVAYKLRNYKKVKTAVKLGMTLDPSKKERRSCSRSTSKRVRSKRK